jgi:tetrahydromethanopterin S-methyltransferase subunit G
VSEVREDQTAAHLRQIDARLDRLDARVEALAREQSSLTGRRPRRDNLDRLVGTIRMLLIVCAVGFAAGVAVLALQVLFVPHPPHLPR